MNTMNKLVEAFGHEKRWYNWRYKIVEGRKTKVPYAVNGKRGSSTDSNTWSTHAEALEASENIGIVFTPEQTLLGIDIDHCLDRKTKTIEHEQKEIIEKLISESNTYTEISPSGEGIHLYFRLETSLSLTSNRKPPYEAYTAGRYFTVTGVSLGDAKDVRTISTEEAIRLLGIIGYPWKSAEPQNKAVENQQQLAGTLTLDDSQVLERMFASKNGNDIKKLYDGDVSGYDKNKSVGDMALCSHLAFWTRKDALQIERIWTNSPLGNRDKTQKRADYRNSTIDGAIKNTRDMYEPSPVTKARIENEKQELDLMYTLDSKGNKIFIQNTENMCRILRGHEKFKDTLRYDIFKNKLEIHDHGTWRLFEDNDEVVLQTRVQIAFPLFGRVGKEMIRDAMIRVARENTIDIASDYIKSLVWDGTPRLDTWLSKTYGVPSDSYYNAVGSNWIKGLIKRIVDPGCKFDYVIVIEGPQGAKKSTSLAILGETIGHIETTMGMETKDFFMQFQGNAIIEFSEGDTLNRTDIKRMKAVITTQVDKYRPAYGRAFVEFPRRCVFAMTTNDEEYLRDETGNRRWLPIKMVFNEADIVWLQANKDQLYAEAYDRVVNKKESVYEFPREETTEMQNQRRVHYEYEDVIIDWYHHKLSDKDREQGVTVYQVYQNAIHGGMTSKLMSKYDEMRIADVLKSTLKFEKRRSMIGHTRSTRWFDPKIDVSNVVIKSVIEQEDDY